MFLYMRRSESPGFDIAPGDFLTACPGLAIVASIATTHSGTASRAIRDDSGAPIVTSR
jgi:hypothetical protein